MYSCWDINYNVRRGAQLFSQKIAAAGGNVIQAIGAYNGWQPGLTVDSALSAKWAGTWLSLSPSLSACDCFSLPLAASGPKLSNLGRCLQQQNLDYLHQVSARRRCLHEKRPKN